MNWSSEVVVSLGLVAATLPIGVQNISLGLGYDLVIKSCTNHGMIRKRRSVEVDNSLLRLAEKESDLHINLLDPDLTSCMCDKRPVDSG